MIFPSVQSQKLVDILPGTFPAQALVSQLSENMMFLIYFFTFGVRGVIFVSTGF